MDNYLEKFNRYLDIFNEYLDENFNKLNSEAPSVIKDAMRYAILGGGKRVRPVLCLALAEAFVLPFDTVLSFALAIECIHTYSLVHDDLPAMDNDDYRRGRLSTHKKYGEAIGILTGDALLNYAFEACLSKENITANDIKAMRVIAKLAGYNGMIAGQVLDLESEKGENHNLDTLYKIIYNKTAKLISAPLMVVSCFIDSKYKSSIVDYGYNLGVLFQITDDILDVVGNVETIGKTPNKDAEAGKLTSVNLVGLEKAKELAKLHFDNAITALSNIPNNEFLVEFTKKMFERNK